mgnify:CR=1 FL=1
MFGHALCNDARFRANRGLWFEMMRLHLYETWHNRKVAVAEERRDSAGSLLFDGDDDDMMETSRCNYSSLTGGAGDAMCGWKRRTSNGLTDEEEGSAPAKRCRRESTLDYSYTDNAEATDSLADVETPAAAPLTNGWLNGAFDQTSVDEREYAEVVDIEIETLMTDVSGRVRDMSGMSQQPQYVNTLTRPLYLRVYPSEHPDS